MKTTIKISGYILVAISVLSLTYVSLLAWIDPKAIMALVQVELTNTDALSSIRGVYGGVGISLILLIIYITLKDISNGLLFLGIFWLLYACSRVITLLSDGPLGDFGNTWFKIELLFSALAWIFYFLMHRKQED